MRRGWAAATLVVAVSLGAGAGRAHAFSRYQIDADKPFFWRKSCVVVTVYLNGFDKSPRNHMRPDEILKSVAAAAEAWGSNAVTCGGAPSTRPSIEIVPTLAPPGEKPPLVGDDARSTIVFRTENWTRSGLLSGTAYNPNAVAVTHVHPAPDGHITDADIEVNAVGKDWVNRDTNASLPGNPQEFVTFTDLQNTLTHEFGHLLGLEHTCFNPAKDTPDVNADGKARWNDDQNNPVPNCKDAPAAVARTVMFDQVDPQDTSRRTLSPDEVAATCAIYPADREHEACALDSPTGCAVATRPPRSSFLGLVLVAVPVLTARRRARP